MFHLRQGSARCCVRPRTLSLCCSYFAFLRGLFFLLLRLLRSFERESRKNCDVILYRSIDSRRNFFRRRFFATMMAKKRPNRSIVVLPVAWSFLEWSDAISLSLSLSLFLSFSSHQKGDWKQVGHVPRFVAGGLRREGRAGRAGVEEILLSTHAHVSRGSDRETFELQHARTTRIERFDLRLLLVWRKKERALVLVLVLVLLPLPRGCARACVY